MSRVVREVALVSLAGGGDGLDAGAVALVANPVAVVGVALGGGQAPAALARVVTHGALVDAAVREAVDALAVHLAQLEPAGVAATVRPHALALALNLVVHERTLVVTPVRELQAAAAVLDALAEIAPVGEEGVREAIGAVAVPSAPGVRLASVRPIQLVPVEGRPSRPVMSSVVMSSAKESETDSLPRRVFTNVRDFDTVFFVPIVAGAGANCSPAGSLSPAGAAELDALRSAYKPETHLLPHSDHGR